MGGGNIDMIHPRAEIGDQLQARAGLRDQFLVQAIGDGGGEHIGPLQGADQGLGAHGFVGQIEFGVEEFPHAGFHRIRELARHDNFRLARGHGGV